MSSGESLSKRHNASATARPPSARSVPRARQSRRWVQVALPAVGLAAVGLAGIVLYDSSDELFIAADTLTKVHWAWVVVAIFAEVASYWFRGAAQAVVLRQGMTSLLSGSSSAESPAPFDRAARGGPGSVVLAAATWAGSSVSSLVPIGFAASGAVMLRVLHRRGVDGAVAAWMFAVSSLIYLATIAVLTIIAVQIAGGSDVVPGLQTVSFGLIGALVVIALAYAVWRRRLGRRDPQRGAGKDLRTAQSSRSSLARWAQRQLAELRVIRMSSASMSAAVALTTICWLCDIAVLGVAYAALDTAPPWSGLLLAYCAGQIAAAVPITPGGVGAVEGSLTLALVAFGGAQMVTLAAVLFYRLITYWGCIPVGGLLWVALRATAPKRKASALAQPAPEEKR
ncbi:MAG: flippase-like domain-containing protein [Pseudonocardia sp.]|nr:flippase-like domain-containing protein [Pseudonocardia sp.]